MSQGASSQSPQAISLEPGRLRALSDEIENLEEQLRQTNPAYRMAAQVRQVSLPDVGAELRTGGRGTEGLRSRGAGQGPNPRCPDNVIADPSGRRLFRADHEHNR